MLLFESPRLFETALAPHRTSPGLLALARWRAESLPPRYDPRLCRLLFESPRLFEAALAPHRAFLGAVGLDRWSLESLPPQCDPRLCRLLS